MPDRVAPYRPMPPVAGTVVAGDVVDGNDGNRPPIPDMAVDAVLLRLGQILETHRDDPGRQPAETDYRALARQLAEEARAIKEHVEQDVERGVIASDQAEAELSRRILGMARLESDFTPDSPESVAERMRFLKKADGVPGNQVISGDQLVPSGQLVHSGERRLANAVGWMPLLVLDGYNAPGPVGVAIRTLGDQVFRVFPCFGDMVSRCRERGRDPLGQIQVVSTMHGETAADVEPTLAALRDFAFPLKLSAFRGLSRMPGYRPDISVAFSESTTFVLVKERRSQGCPIDAESVYAFSGGMSFYEKNPAMIARLREIVDFGRIQELQLKHGHGSIGHFLSLPGTSPTQRTQKDEEEPSNGILGLR